MKSPQTNLRQRGAVIWTVLLLAWAVWDYLAPASLALRFEPFSFTAFFISLALSGASYLANRFLGPKPPTIQRGKLEGELNIQNSQSGTAIPEIFGGDVTEFVGDDDDGSVDPGPGGTVVVTPPGGGSPVTLGLAWAWHDAADIGWASNNSTINSVATGQTPANIINQNLTRIWPGKGIWKNTLYGSTWAGYRAFAYLPLIEPYTFWYEPVPTTFPTYRGGLINGKPAVRFTSGAGVSSLQSPGGVNAGEAMTVFLVTRLNPYVRQSGFLWNICSISSAYYSILDHDTMGLAYYADLDAFGFSMNHVHGDVHGFGNAGDILQQWVLITAIFFPNEDALGTRRLRINGVEQVVSMQRAPDGASILNLATFPIGPYYALGSTHGMSNATREEYQSAGGGSASLSPQRGWNGDLAEALVVTTSGAPNAANLSLTETVLMNKYGIVA